MASGSFGTHPLLFGTGIAYGVLSAGHVMKGLEQFKHPTTNTLPLWLRGAAKIGWYEGGVFLAISGLLNYKWSQQAFLDATDKTIVGLLVTMLFGAGASYWRIQDRPTAAVVLAVGGLQALAASRAL